MGAGIPHHGAGAKGEELAQADIALPADTFVPGVCRRLACSRGVKPHQAAKSRAVRNRLPSPTALTMAWAVRPPTPGIVASRRIAGSVARDRHDPILQVSRSPRSARRSAGSAAAARPARATGMSASLDREPRGSVASKPRRPAAAMMPNSASWLRTLFISCVRCFTSSIARAFQSRARPAARSLLIATIAHVRAAQRGNADRRGSRAHRSCCA